MKLVFGYVDYTKSLNSTNATNLVLQNTKHANISLQTNASKTSSYDDNELTIVFNGTLSEHTLNVINHIKNTYTSQGFAKMIETLSGVFSLTLYDKRTQKVYISRDHLGVYPLFYYIQNEIILFSNDLKQFRDINLFKKEIDTASLALFFQNEYIPAPHTIFKNCFKLPPASYLELDIQAQTHTVISYWDLKSFYLLEKSKESEETIIEKSEMLLTKAIQEGIGADKKAGAFLSGGFDSATILALCHKLDKTKNYTFTMGFDDKKHNEADVAKEISQHLKSEHAEHILTKEDVLDRLDEIAHIYPEPFGDKAALASMILVENAKDEVQTLFGGEGGDELFYSSSFLSNFERLQNIPSPLRWIISKILKLHPAIKYQKWGNMISQSHIEDILVHKDILMTEKECQTLIKNAQPLHKVTKSKSQNRSKNFMDNIFPAIIKHYVSNNLLTKVGALSLHHDVDIKLPYLDKDLIEYLATIEAETKYKEGIRKYILKQITYKYIPQSLMDRPKKGFSVPLGEYVKSDFDAISQRYFNKAKIEQEGILNYAEVEKIISQFLTEDSYYSEQKMWNLLLFQVWYNYWFNQNRHNK